MCFGVPILPPKIALPEISLRVAGGFTWCVGEKLEVVSPQQFSRAGRETLTSSTQRQVATLGLEPPSGQNVFLGADFA